MTPTMELRFIEREEFKATQVYADGTSIGTTKKIRILQQ